jgi:hypothetical protein
MKSFNEGDHAGQEDIDRLLQRQYEVDVFGFLRQGWELFRQEPGKFIGYSLILMVAYLVNQMFVAMVNYAYITGGFQRYSTDIYPMMILTTGITVFINLLFVPLYSGGSIAAFRLMSGQKVGFGDFFHGYRYWSPLIFYTLVQGGITFIAVSAFTLVIGLYVFFQRFIGPSFSLMQYQAAFSQLLTVLIFAVLIYIFIAYVFSSFIIIDRRTGFWQAMETSRKVVNRRWFSVFGLLMLLALLILPGFVLLIFMQNAFAILVVFAGLLVIIPLSGLTIAVAYREIFGLRGSDW